jgi:hypothetical protein
MSSDRTGSGGGRIAGFYGPQVSLQLVLPLRQLLTPQREAAGTTQANTAHMALLDIAMEK